ncbi:MauE/DoxX family redox-associated membrane protein [Kineococcus gypseus]|uniref:MauE/DoxX family redox-associated membrane protein n=1 Tax=Kineococcus gypseus TaxID=1637102 RepID=UPI003D7CED85
MTATLLPHLAGCALLLVAGVAKLRRPDGTARALRAQHLPAGTGAVRLLGAGEVALALAALAGAPGAAWAVAAAYAGFTAFVVVALVRDAPLSSCGCFGEPDLPPTRTHVVVTALLAAASAGTAVAGTAGGAATGAAGLLAAGAPAAAAAAGLTALVAWLALLSLTALPRLAAARRPLRTAPGRAS